MELSLADYQSLLSKVRGTQLVYLEDMTHGGDDEDGFWTATLPTPGRTRQSCCATSACGLHSSTPSRACPSGSDASSGMYYEHDMNLKEIAAVLGVTESRVCQLHSQSIARLRAKMRSH